MEKVNLKNKTNPTLIQNEEVSIFNILMQTSKLSRFSRFKTCKLDDTSESVQNFRSFFETEKNQDFFGFSYWAFQIKPKQNNWMSQNNVPFQTCPSYAALVAISLQFIFPYILNRNFSTKFSFLLFSFSFCCTKFHLCVNRMTRAQSAEWVSILLLLWKSPMSGRRRVEKKRKMKKKIRR